MIKDTEKQSTQSSTIATELGHFLADTYLVYLKTQNFHWNVSGPYFYTLHKMFEEQYVELATAIDEIAERIRALGLKAPASFSQFLGLTRLKEDKSDVPSKDMVAKLLADHELLAEYATKLMGLAEQVSDETTVDLMVSRLQVHQKTSWMLRSSLE